MHGIVIVARGVRDPEWVRPFEAIRDNLRRQRPECPVGLAYLEHLSPTVEEAVASVVEEGAPAVTVFPLLIGLDSHVRDDLPRLLEQIRPRYPHVPIALEKALGDAPEVTAAIAGWILGRVD